MEGEEFYEGRVYANLAQIVSEGQLPSKTEQVPGGCVSYYNVHKLGVLIESVSSDKRGAGSEVLKKLKSKIGLDTRVSAPQIVEPQTLNSLEKLGITQRIKTSKLPEIIRDPEILKELKLARVFEKGGFEDIFIVGKPVIDDKGVVKKVNYDIECHT